jgi:hypothetical protein
VKGGLCKVASQAGDLYQVWQQHPGDGGKPVESSQGCVVLSGGESWQLTQFGGIPVQLPPR